MSIKCAIILILTVFIASSAFVQAVAQEEAAEIEEGEEEIYQALTPEEIQKLFDEGKIEEAIRECQKMVENFPWTWEARWAQNKIVEYYIQTGKKEEADRILQEMLKRAGNPSEAAEASLQMMRLAREQNNTEEVKRWYDAIAPKYIGEHFTLEAMAIMAESYMKKGMLKEATEIADKMQKDYPLHGQTLHTLIWVGDIHAERGENEAAVKYYSHIRQGAKGDFEVERMFRGYEQLGLPDEAVALCDEVISKYPDTWEAAHAAMRKGDILSKTDPAAAAEAYMAVTKYTSYFESVEAYRKVAESYIAIGETEKAITTLRKLASGEVMPPIALEALKEIGKIYERAWQIEEALTVYEEVVSKYPKTRQAAEARMAIIHLLMKEGRQDEALAKIVKLSEESTASRMKIEVAMQFSHQLVEFGQPESAVSLLQTAMQAAPDKITEMEILRHLASILERIEDFKGAIALYEKMKGQNDLILTLESLDGLSRCYERMGDGEKSIEYIEQILNMAPDGSKAFHAKFRKAMCLLKPSKEKVEAAKQILQKIVEDYPESQESGEARRILDEMMHR